MAIPSKSEFQIHWSLPSEENPYLQLKIGEVALKSFSGREFNRKGYTLKAWVECIAQGVGLVSKMDVTVGGTKKTVLIWNNLFGPKENPESYGVFAKTHEKALQHLHSIVQDPEEIKKIFQKAYALPDSQIVASYKIHILNPTTAVLIEKMYGQVSFAKFSLEKVLNGRFEEIQSDSTGSKKQSGFPLRLSSLSDFEKKLKKEMNKKGWVIKEG